MEKNCRFGSSLASSAILLMSVHIMFRVLSLVMSPFNRFVRLLPPSLQRVPWPPPFGSPAVPHLPRYYGVVRLLRHPSAPPPVDPRVRVPPDTDTSLLVWEEMGSSLEFPASLSGTCPGLGTPPIPARPRNSGRYRILPSARLNTSASGRRNDFGADPHGLFPCCVRFAPTSHPVNGNTRY